MGAWSDLCIPRRRLLCEVHEEYATNISLALQGYWVGFAPHCVPCVTVLCSGQSI